MIIEKKTATFPRNSTFSKSTSLYLGDQLSKYMFAQTSGEYTLKNDDEWFKPMLTPNKQERQPMYMFTHNKRVKHAKYVNVYGLTTKNLIVTRRSLFSLV